MSKFEAPRSSETRLSRASIGRFSLYLRHLEHFKSDGQLTVSSSQLGEALGITDAQVRKDLAYFGSVGHPGVGYSAEELTNHLRKHLGLNRQWTVVVAGVGNLARALLRYGGFREQGFRIQALFDSDPAKVGAELEGLKIYGLDQMPAIVRATGAELGVLTVPSAAAQGVADLLVAAGIRGILNFAPTVLKLPSGISLVPVDLAVQMEQLAFLVHLSKGEE